MQESGAGAVFRSRRDRFFLLLYAAPAPFSFLRLRPVRHLGAPARGIDGVASCGFLSRSKPRLGRGK